MVPVGANMQEKNQTELWQQLILEIALDFIHLSPVQVDETVNRMLKRIAEFASADRAWILKLDRRSHTLGCSHEWCAQGVAPQIEQLQRLSLKKFPWIGKQLSSGGAIRIGDVHKMPNEVMCEIAKLTAPGVRSLLALPLQYSNSRIGLIGFDSVGQKRIWNDETIALVTKAAEIAARVLVHQSMELKLHESQERYRLLVENLNDGIVISQNDKFIFFNRQFTEMLGYSHDELRMADYRQVYTDEGLAILKERARRRKQGANVPSRYETVFKRKNGDYLHVEANVSIIDYQGAPATFAIISDISERKEAEKYQHKLEVDLMKRQKVSSMGLFADGIIHNMRNELAVIIGRAQLLQQKMPDLREPEIIISNAGKILQMADIFLKKAKLVRTDKIMDIDLNDLIRTEVLFIKSNQYVRDRVDIRFDLDRTIPAIRGYYSDFSLALAGIIEFCIDAMADVPQPTLRIADTSDQNSISLILTYSGRRLTTEDLQTIITPFFSLQQRGKTPWKETDNVKTVQLHNAYMLLERYGVKFRAKTIAAEKTIFELTIPVFK
ncbi:MAG: PAS domain S-box protein [Fidelibacterota bacterium]